MNTPSGSAAPAVPDARTAMPLKIAFALMGLQGRLRLFEGVIEGLLERGHRVHVLFEEDEWRGQVEREWRDRMARFPGFSEETVRALDSDRWAGTATRLHCATKYVRDRLSQLGTQIAAGMPSDWATST